MRHKFSFSEHPSESGPARRQATQPGAIHRQGLRDANEPEQVRAAPV